MSGDRRKEIVPHLSEDDLDRLLAETDDEKISKRLTFIKNLTKGDTLEEAADRVGKSASTGSRWARRWNEDGLGLLTPNFGGGPPPKLDDDEQEHLLELLRDDQPGKNRRFSTSSIRSLMCSSIQSTSVNSSTTSVFRARFHGQNVPPNLRTPMKSSTNASPTRSTKMTTNPTTNARVTTKKAGSLTTISVQTAGPFSAFLIRHIHSRGTTLSRCTTSMIPISPDRWFVLTNQRSASTRSTARAW